MNGLFQFFQNMFENIHLQIREDGLQPVHGRAREGRAGEAR